MWHALKAELTYSRPWLLGALGIAAGVTILLTFVFLAIGDGPERHTVAGLRAMFLLMAPIIVSYIVQGLRAEERRALLLLAGDLTPRQIAGTIVLLPIILLGIGVLGAGLVLGADYLITGPFPVEALNLVGSVGSQMFTYGMLALLIQEAVAAYRQQRRRATAACWAGFALAALFLAALYVTLAQELLTWGHVFLGHLIVAVAAMAATVVLYAGRTDFTR